MSYSTPAKIKYDPHNERGTFQKWWVIAQIDRELIRYYQHVFYKIHYKKLQTAMWSGHVSIVRGEEPKYREAWKKFNGEIVQVNYEYEGGFYTNGKHFWIHCFAPEFGYIRQSLGLPREPKLPYHISIGSLGL